MGFKKMETNLTFTDISLFSSLEKNRAIKRMEQINAKIQRSPFLFVFVSFFNKMSRTFKRKQSSVESLCELCKALSSSISASFIAKLTAAALVLLLSLLIMPFYTDGDQTVYGKVYEALPDLGLTEGFIFYSLSLSSEEFVHFFLSWVASRFVEKGLFIALSNAILAYVTMSLFQKWRASVIIAFLLLLTNFYFLVLYFAAERLKFGFIFLALSMTYIDHVKRFFGFATLALISHVQIIIVYVSILFNVFVRQIVKLFRTATVSKSLLFLIPFLFIPPLLVQDQIIAKFHSYYNVRTLTELAKILVFLLLSLWYSKKKMETIILFIPIVITVYLVGGFRVNLFGYFVFLYYGLQFRGGWNFGVLATSAYFAYSSIGFLANVFQHGDGFFSG